MKKTIELQILTKINQYTDYIYYSLKDSDSDGMTPLIEVFLDAPIQLSQKETNYLIQNSDLNVRSPAGNTPIMLLFLTFVANDKINDEQIDYLIQNTDLTQLDYEKFNVIHYAARAEINGNIHLNELQWQYMLQNVDYKKAIKNIKFKNNYPNPFNLLKKKIELFDIHLEKEKLEKNISNLQVFQQLRKI